MVATGKNNGRSLYGHVIATINRRKEGHTCSPSGTAYERGDPWRRENLTDTNEEAGMGSYMVREEGKNGKVEIFADRIVRTRQKRIGKDDVQTFPLTAITSISHDRKTLGTDEVKIQFGPVAYQWKVKNAEAMVAEIHGHMFKTDA
jgi:hypothetical protein